MMEPKVSVVVPVYNVEKYLQLCISSIMHQSLKNIEIILVDDGSTDASGKICDEYAEIDSRIHVIHKKNGGLSSARNVGIKQSKGHYIMFVDSDDWVENDFCRYPYKVAKIYDSDIVLFPHKRVYRIRKNKRIGLKGKSRNISEIEALKVILYQGAYVWGGLYRRTLFDNIKYPEGKFYEDEGTTHRIIHNSNNIYYLNRVLYNYRYKRNGGITSKTTINKRILADRKEMTALKINDLCEWGFTKMACKDALNMLAWYGVRGNKQSRYMDIVDNSKLEILDGCSWKFKIIFLIYKFSPRLFDYVCILFRKRCDG